VVQATRHQHLSKERAAQAALAEVFYQQEGKEGRWRREGERERPSRTGGRREISATVVHESLDPPVAGIFRVSVGCARPEFVVTAAR